MRVTSAAEMREAVMARMGEATVVLKAAAVADFRMAAAVHRGEDEAGGQDDAGA